MAIEKRKIFRMVWQEIKMEQLETGNVFKMVELDGTSVEGTWVADEKPTIDGNGVWTVNCHDMKDNDIKLEVN